MPLSIKKFENIVIGLSIDAYIDNKQNVWFKGRDIATALGYENKGKAIRDHVDEEYKIERRDIKGVRIVHP